MHFQGSNWLSKLMGVGLCIHWITSQLFTIHTSGIRTISSKKRFNKERRKN